MRHPKKLDIKEEARRAQIWNSEYPIGTRVALVLDNGTSIVTTTDSEAWLLGHGQAVISVAGKSGGWALDRVHVIVP